MILLCASGVWVNDVPHTEGADVIAVQQGQPLKITCSLTNVAGNMGFIDGVYSIEIITTLQLFVLML